MNWQSALDRLTLREVDTNGGNASRQESVAELIHSLIRLNPSRSESYFHLGYAAGAFDLKVEAVQPEELDAAASRWYRFGEALALLTRRDRRPRRGEEDEEGTAPAMPAEPDLGPLLEDPTIAAELLPIILRRSLQSGDLEESVRTLETVLSTGANDEKTSELLRSTLSEILRRAERPRENLDTNTVLGLLHRCMALPGFENQPSELRAPFHRTLGKLQQHVENYDEAADEFRRALEIAGEGHTLASVLHFDLAGCLLRIRGVPDLEPVADRGDVTQAMKHLDEATADVKKASFNAFFTRGILRFEKEDYTNAAHDFQAALERIEMYRNPLPVTLARIRYFLALALLRGGTDEEGREEAIKQLERALDRVRPSLETLEELLPLLREHNPRTAVRALSRIDLTHTEDPAVVIGVGNQYRELGDAEGALKVAEMALEKIEDIDMRKQALLLELRCFNMLGERENARDAIYDLRDLCYQSGDLQLWEEVIFDDDRSGQALDRGRVLAERLELLNRLPERDAERAELIREIADGYLNRAEPHWRVTGLRTLKEANRAHPGEFEDDLAKAQASLGAVEQDYDGSMARRAQEALGRTPSVVVLGGDEHQDRREDDLDAIASEWGIEAEWWPTDYVNPDRVFERLKEHLTAHQPDGILLLHSNREELIREVRKYCRSYRIPTRFAHHAGPESLRQGVGELLEAATQRQERLDDESSVAGA